MATTLLLRNNRQFLKGLNGQFSNSLSLNMFSTIQYHSEGVVEDEAPCPHAQQLQRAAAMLASSKTLDEKYHLTCDIRNILSRIPPIEAEFVGIDGAMTSAEPIYLRLTSEITQINELYDNLVAYVEHEDENQMKIMGQNGIEQDDDDIDDLATDTPISERTLTFGTTPFESIAAILRLLEERYHLGSDGSLGSWIDLGSGDGHPTLAAALLKNWKQCCGIEVKKSLFQKSMKLKSIYDESVEQEEADFQQKLQKGDVAHSKASKFSPMMFVNQDLRNCYLKKKLLKSVSRDEDNLVDLETASVVFIHATCFDDKTMLDVASLVPKVKPGTFFISVTKPIRSKYLQLLEQRTLPFSWGVGTVYIHRRLEESSYDMEKLPQSKSVALLSQSGDRYHNPFATEVSRSLGFYRVMNDPLDETLSNVTCSDLLVHQLIDGMNTIFEKTSAETLDKLKVLNLATESLFVLALASNEEMNARSIIDSGKLVQLHGSILRHGLVRMLDMRPQDLSFIDNHDLIYPKLLGAWASSCLAANAMSAHYGCVEELNTCGVVASLVKLINEEDEQSHTRMVPVSIAIKGAAAACLCNCATHPQVAFELKEHSKLDKTLRDLISAHPDNESFCESAQAAITAIERFSPLYQPPPRLNGLGM